MARSFLTSIDLNNNELQNARVHYVATAPSTPVAGQIYYNSSSNKLFVYNSSTWVDLAGSGGTLNFSGTAGSGSVDLSTASFVIYGGNGVTTSANGASIRVSTPQALDTSDSPSFAAVTASNGVITSGIYATDGASRVLYTGTSTGANASFAGYSASANTLRTTRSFVIYGAVSAATVNFDGSANASFNTVLTADAVTLGTHTTGNYVAGASGGTGVTVSGTPGEGWTPSFAIGQDVATTASVQFARTSLSEGVYASNGTSRVLYPGTSTGVGASLAGLAASASRLETARNIALTGTVTGTASFDGTADASIATTLANDSVTLGTHTTGNYVASVSAGTGVNVTGTIGEGWTPSISIGQNVNTSASPTFARVTAGQGIWATGGTTRILYTGSDSSGTGASLAGLAASASRLETARNIALSGDVTGTTSFDGTGDVTITATIAPSASPSFTNIRATGNLTVDGNLTVSGNTTVVNTSTIALEDPMLALGSGNTTSDVVDLGFYGTYYDGSTVRYSGLFRDASDNSKYKLFKGSSVEPGTTVNVSGDGYSQATLVATHEGDWAGNAIPVAYGGTGATTVAAAKTSLGYVSSASALLTGSSTTHVITHNLGTRAVVVEVWNTTTYETVICDVARTTTNTVTLTFNAAVGGSAYAVVVIG